MKTVTVNTAELEGAALDWAVAAAVGEFDDGEMASAMCLSGDWQPSDDWAQGGPLIENYTVALLKQRSYYSAVAWNDKKQSGDADGPTHLITAMRAIVASELGDTVEIPGELVK